MSKWQLQKRCWDTLSNRLVVASTSAANGNHCVCAGWNRMRTPVPAGQFPSLLRAEVKAVLCHGQEFVWSPNRFHETPAGVRLVTEKQVPDLVGGGIGQHGDPRKVCVSSFLLRRL
jgi:hypothetical protein